MASQIIFNRLIRKLTIPEPLASHLIRMPLKASPSLDIKLLHIEDIISSILPQEKQLFEEWREHLIILYAKHSGMVWLECDELHDVQPVAEDLDDSKSTTDSFSSFLKEPEVKDEVKYQQPIQTDPPKNIKNPIANEKYILREMDFDAKIPKDVIRSQMEVAFSQLTFKSPNDIYAMKRLLSLVAKSHALSMPFGNDRQLQQDLFFFALARLPASIRATFMADYCHDQQLKQLYRLKCFLQHEIIIYYKELNSSNWPKDGPLKLCDYCKQTGE